MGSLLVKITGERPSGFMIMTPSVVLSVGLSFSGAPTQPSAYSLVTKVLFVPTEYVSERCSLSLLAEKFAPNVMKLIAQEFPTGAGDV